MALLQKRKNGNDDLFPFRRNDFLNRFFSPRLFDSDDDFWGQNIGIPPVNISETDKEFKLDLSVPGLKKEDFHIDVDRNVLTISSEKKEESNEDEKNYRRREFSYSSFSRTFQLPEDVDENNIGAKYENGMLQINIPKKEGANIRRKREISVS